MIAVREPVPGREAGWTFVEAIVVIAIIVILTGTVAFSSVRYIDRARIASAGSQLDALQLALHAYYLDNGRYPTEAQGLDSLWTRPAIAPIAEAWNGPYVERAIGTDPWGSAFDYRAPGPNGLPFEIRSLGADHLPGGAAAAADLSTAE